MTRHDPSLAREFAAALAWWQMAGVDCDYADDATAWLSDAPRAAPDAGAAGQGKPLPRPASPVREGADNTARPTAPAAATSALPATTRRDLLGDSPPADLAAFRQWWMEAPGLDAARGFPRVPPRGEAGAALMVLVPQPEEGDRDRLLSGPQGRLLAAILAAMGISEDAVYIAAALPTHTPMADLSALAAGGLDAVTLHHIGLVAPARLIAFGTGLAPMLGEVSGQPLREINYVRGKVPVMSSEALDALMEMPRLKARLWRRWIEWSATV
jgi:DNA polymerase